MEDSTTDEPGPFEKAVVDGFLSTFQTLCPSVRQSFLLRFLPLLDKKELQDFSEITTYILSQSNLEQENNDPPSSTLADQGSNVDDQGTIQSNNDPTFSRHEDDSSNIESQGTIQSSNANFEEILAKGYPHGENEPSHISASHNDIPDGPDGFQEGKDDANKSDEEEIPMSIEELDKRECVVTLSCDEIDSSVIPDDLLETNELHTTKSVNQLIDDQSVTKSSRKDDVNDDESSMFETWQLAANPDGSMEDHGIISPCRITTSNTGFQPVADSDEDALANEILAAESFIEKHIENQIQATSTVPNTLLEGDEVSSPNVACGSKDGRDSYGLEHGFQVIDNIEKISNSCSSGEVTANIPDSRESSSNDETSSQNAACGSKEGVESFGVENGSQIMDDNEKISSSSSREDNATMLDARESSPNDDMPGDHVNDVEPTHKESQTVPENIQSHSSNVAKPLEDHCYFTLSKKPKQSKKPQIEHSSELEKLLLNSEEKSVSLGEGEVSGNLVVSPWEDNIIDLCGKDDSEKNISENIVEASDLIIAEKEVTDEQNVIVLSDVEDNGEDDMSCNLSVKAREPTKIKVRANSKTLMPLIESIGERVERLVDGKSNGSDVTKTGPNKLQEEDLDNPKDTHSNSFKKTLEETLHLLKRGKVEDWKAMFSEDGTPRIRCARCEAPCKSLQDLQDHQKSHVRIGCTACRSIFPQSSLPHYCSGHTKPSFPCSECHSLFPSIEERSTHVQLVHSWFACNCKTIFRYHMQLQVHQLRCLYSCNETVSPWLLGERKDCIVCGVFRPVALGNAVCNECHLFFQAFCSIPNSSLVCSGRLQCSLKPTTIKQCHACHYLKCIAAGLQDKVNRKSKKLNIRLAGQKSKTPDSQVTLKANKSGKFDEQSFQKGKIVHKIIGSIGSMGSIATKENEKSNRSDVQITKTSLPIPPPVPRSDEPNLLCPCLVCKSMTKTRYQGKVICQNCKLFFEKSITQNLQKPYKCKHGIQCELNANFPHGICSVCRLVKCIQVGLVFKGLKPVAVPGSRIQCPICIFCSRSVGFNLAKHVSRHNKIFKCDPCQKVFFSKGRYVIHKEHHENAGTLCQMCGAVFPFKRLMKNHGQVCPKKPITEARHIAKMMLSTTCPLNNVSDWSHIGVAPHDLSLKSLYMCRVCGRRYCTCHEVFDRCKRMCHEVGDKKFLCRSTPAWKCDISRTECFSCFVFRFIVLGDLTGSQKANAQVEEVARVAQVAQEPRPFIIEPIETESRQEENIEHLSTSKPTIKTEDTADKQVFDEAISHKEKSIEPPPSVNTPSNPNITEDQREESASDLDSSELVALRMLTQGSPLNTHSPSEWGNLDLFPHTIGDTITSDLHCKVCGFDNCVCMETFYQCERTLLETGKKFSCKARPSWRCPIVNPLIRSQNCLACLVQKVIAVGAITQSHPDVQENSEQQSEPSQDQQRKEIERTIQSIKTEEPSEESVHILKSAIDKSIQKTSETEVEKEDSPAVKNKINKDSIKREIPGPSMVLPSIKSVEKSSQGSPDKKLKCSPTDKRLKSSPTSLLHVANIMMDSSCPLFTSRFRKWQHNTQDSRDLQDSRGCCMLCGGHFASNLCKCSKTLSSHMRSRQSSLVPRLVCLNASAAWRCDLDLIMQGQCDACHMMNYLLAGAPGMEDEVCEKQNVRRCPVCQVTTISEWFMKRHLRTHSEAELAQVDQSLLANESVANTNNENNVEGAETASVDGDRALSDVISVSSHSEQLQTVIKDEPMSPPSDKPMKDDDQNNKEIEPMSIPADEPMEDGNQEEEEEIEQDEGLSSPSHPSPSVTPAPSEAESITEGASLYQLKTCRVCGFVASSQHESLKHLKRGCLLRPSLREIKAPQSSKTACSQDMEWLRKDSGFMIAMSGVSRTSPLISAIRKDDLDRCIREKEGMKDENTGDKDEASKQQELNDFNSVDVSSLKFAQENMCDEEEGGDKKGETNEPSQIRKSSPKRPIKKDKKQRKKTPAWSVGKIKKRNRKTIKQSSNQSANKSKAEDVLKCGKCSFSTLDKSELERHSNTHSFKRPVWCSICSRKFNDAYTRNFHIVTSHSNYKYGPDGRPKHPCELCSKPCASASQLAAHVNQHRRTECSTCGTLYMVHNGHTCTGTKLQFHECKDCGWLYQDKNRLTDHVASLHRWYACACHRLFQWKSELDVHRRACLQGKKAFSDDDDVDEGLLMEMNLDDNSKNSTQESSKADSPATQSPISSSLGIPEDDMKVESQDEFESQSEVSNNTQVQLKDFYVKLYRDPCIEQLANEYRNKSSKDLETSRDSFSSQDDLLETENDLQDDKTSDQYKDLSDDDTLEEKIGDSFEVSAFREKSDVIDGSFDDGKWLQDALDFAKQLDVCVDDNATGFDEKPSKALDVRRPSTEKGSAVQNQENMLVSVDNEDKISDSNILGESCEQNQKGNEMSCHKATNDSDICCQENTSLKTKDNSEKMENVDLQMFYTSEMEAAQPKEKHDSHKQNTDELKSPTPKNISHTENREEEEVSSTESNKMLDKPSPPSDISALMESLPEVVTVSFEEAAAAVENPELSPNTHQGIVNGPIIDAPDDEQMDNKVSDVNDSPKCENQKEERNIWSFLQTVTEETPTTRTKQEAKPIENVNSSVSNIIKSSDNNLFSNLGQRNHLENQLIASENLPPVDSNPLLESNEIKEEELEDEIVPPQQETINSVGSYHVDSSSIYDNVIIARGPNNEIIYVTAGDDDKDQFDSMDSLPLTVNQPDVFSQFEMPDQFINDLSTSEQQPSLSSTTTAVEDTVEPLQEGVSIPDNQYLVDVGNSDKQGDEAADVDVDIEGDVIEPPDEGKADDELNSSDCQVVMDSTVVDEQSPDDNMFKILGPKEGTTPTSGTTEFMKCNISPEIEIMKRIAIGQKLISHNLKSPEHVGFEQNSIVLPGNVLRSSFDETNNLDIHSNQLENKEIISVDSLDEELDEVIVRDSLDKKRVENEVRVENEAKQKGPNRKRRTSSIQSESECSKPKIRKTSSSEKVKSPTLLNSPKGKDLSITSKNQKQDKSSGKNTGKKKIKHCTDIPRRNPSLKSRSNSLSEKTTIPESPKNAASLAKAATQDSSKRKPSFEDALGSGDNIVHKKVAFKRNKTEKSLGSPQSISKREPSNSNHAKNNKDCNPTATSSSTKLKSILKPGLTEKKSQNNNVTPNNPTNETIDLVKENKKTEKGNIQEEKNSSVNAMNKIPNRKVFLIKRRKSIDSKANQRTVTDIKEENKSTPPPVKWNNDKAIMNDLVQEGHQTVTPKPNTDSDSKQDKKSRFNVPQKSETENNTPIDLDSSGENWVEVDSLNHDKKMEKDVKRKSESEESLGFVGEDWVVVDSLDDVEERTDGNNLEAKNGNSVKPEPDHMLDASIAFWGM